MKSVIKKLAPLFAAAMLVSLCACTRISEGPEVTASPSPTQPEVESPGEIYGYWAALTETEYGAYTLEGYYLSPDGKGLKFTASDGTFEITSYVRNENYITIYFPDVNGDAARDNCRIDKLTNKTLVLIWDDQTTVTFTREEKIEPTGDTGTYAVTQTDGSSVIVDGGAVDADLETVAAITQYLRQYGGMPMFINPNQIEADWIIRRFYTAEPNETGREDYEFFTPLSAVVAAAQRYINPGIEFPSPADLSMDDSETLRWNSQKQGFEWNPSENMTAQYEYIIRRSRVQGGVYKIDCVEVELSWQETGEGRLSGVLLMNGQLIGTIDVSGDGDYEYKYLFDQTAMPGTTFVLREGAADGGERTFIIDRKYRT